MIRRATADDLAAITALYNHYIVDSHVSFDLEPWTLDQRRTWFSKYGGDTPWQVWVAELDDEVVGAAWSSPFRPKAAYDSSVETTIIVAPGHHGRGLGTELYRTLLGDIDTHGAHRAYAIVALPNDASVALHHKLGFVTVGEQHEVGFKMGRFWSTALLERRRLEPGGGS
jgi:phosphinothricin acetyltransferase